MSECVSVCECVGVGGGVGVGVGVWVCGRGGEEGGGRGDN